MANIAGILRDGMGRMSRGEIRKATESIRKATNHHRRAIATLKGQVARLERQVFVLTRTVTRFQQGSSAAADNGSAPKTIRSIGKRLRSHWTRLGLSAGDFGKPVGAMLGLALAATSVTAALAQPPEKIFRLGILSVSTPAAEWRSTPQDRALIESLEQLGYVEGRNLALEIRSAENKLERFPKLASELLALNVDVFWVPTCGAPLDAAMKATSEVPIVVAACSDDMVAGGIVRSLAHPGGNVTGIQKLTPELAAKRLELLKEMMPQASRVAILWNPTYSDFAADWARLRSSARSLGIALVAVPAG